MSLTDRTGLITIFPGVANARIPKDVFYDGDDFSTTPVDDEDYAFTQVTAGTMALAAAGESGVLLLDAVAAASAGDGIQIQRPAASFKPEAGKHIMFSARVKVDLLGVEFFAGLAEIDTSIIVGSAVSTGNHIGFTSITDDGVLLANCEKVTVGTTKAAYSLTADTYVTLGIHIKGVSSVDFYVNDTIVATIDTTANIPIVALSPSFVCQSDGTDATIMSIDYWVCEKPR